MDLKDIAALAGIASIIFTGINFVVMTVAKVFWNLTFNKKKEDDEKRFVKIEGEIFAIKESASRDKEENEAFRHKYKTTVDSLYILIESKFKDFDKHFCDFKELIQAKIDLAIAKNNEKK